MRVNREKPAPAPFPNAETPQVIHLSVEDQRALAEAILNPPEPTPALRRAFRSYRELIRESR